MIIAQEYTINCNNYQTELFYNFIFNLGFLFKIYLEIILWILLLLLFLFGGVLSSHPRT